SSLRLPWFSLAEVELHSTPARPWSGNVGDQDCGVPCSVHLPPQTQRALSLNMRNCFYCFT
uniref:Uncharacterized protein n=1 Tax=Dromaius novaehollandiae TaxID=8790 RepID=A0A8C4JW33_DRONO